MTDFFFLTMNNLNDEKTSQQEIKITSTMPKSNNLSLVGNVFMGQKSGIIKLSLFSYHFDGFALILVLLTCIFYRF